MKAITFFGKAFENGYLILSGNMCSSNCLAFENEKNKPFFSNKLNLKACDRIECSDTSPELRQRRIIGSLWAAGQEVCICLSN